MDNFYGAALQRTHLDHRLEMHLKQLCIDESCIRSRDKNFSRTIHVNRGCGRCCKRSMPQIHKRTASGIARLRALENFFGFKIQESKSHSPMAHNAFKVTSATATTEVLFRIKGHHGVTALSYIADLRV